MEVPQGDPSSLLPEREFRQAPLLRPPRLLEGEEGLEDRRAAGIALGAQAFGDEGEGELPMLEGGERDLPRGPLKLVPGGIAGSAESAAPPG